MCTFQPFQALLAGRLVCTNTEAKYVRPPWPEISLYESLTADISAAIKSSYEIGSVLSEVGWSTVHSVLDRCDPLLPVTYCSQESDTVCPPPHISTPLNLLKTHTGEKLYKCPNVCGFAEAILLCRMKWKSFVVFRDGAVQFPLWCLGAVFQCLPSSSIICAFPPLAFWCNSQCLMCLSLALIYLTTKFWKLVRGHLCLLWFRLLQSLS